MVWNTLNCPCIALPVTTVDPALDPIQPRTEFLGEGDKKNHAFCRSLVAQCAAIFLLTSYCR